MQRNEVFVERCPTYSAEDLEAALGELQPIFDGSVLPGDRVVLKPNWIAPHHRYNKREWESVITHPSLITAVLRRVAKRLAGRGTIVITDGPQTDSSFAAIVERMHVGAWQRIADEHGVPLSVLDLRDMEWREEGDVIFDRKPLPGDPLGSVEFNLRERSHFWAHRPSPKGYYGADYDIAETTAAHTGGDHRYRVSRTAISADVFINLPKLKTHKKAGITCSLKNLVGINTYKNLLPHHTEGTPSMGGDQFPRDNLKSMSEVLLLEQFKRVLLAHPRCGRAFIPLKKLGKLLFGETTQRIRNGAWYGNDTLWRTILDLNVLLLYGNPDGTLRPAEIGRQKRYLSIVDGVIAGDGNGPEAPDPVPAGVIMGGTNPLSVDCVAAKVMGFDYTRIPSLRNAFSSPHFPILDCEYESLVVRSASLRMFSGYLHELPLPSCRRFRPPSGWLGHIEVAGSVVGTPSEWRPDGS